MIEIKNCLFDYQDSAETLKKCTSHGVVINGNENVVIDNCEFANRGYSAVHHCGTGKVEIKNCTFDCSKIYNPIEGQVGADIKMGNLDVINCVFEGTPGNNHVNIYSYDNDTIVNVNGCSFQPGVESQVVRISNVQNSKLTVNVSDCEYSYPEGWTPTQYTGMILCQDFSGNQDFSKCVINVSNVKRNGVVLDKDSENVYYVYQNGAGVITGQNDPVINFK